MVQVNKLPVDPDTKIPAAVRAAAARSDAAQRAANGLDPEEPPITNGEDDPAIEGEDKEKKVAKNNEGNQPPDPPTPPVTSGGNEPDEDQSWEHRYKSMKGRHDRLETVNRQLHDRVAGLENVVATMSVAAPSVTQKQPATDVKPVSFITPQDVTDYGEELLGVVGRKAKEEFSPEITALKQTVADLQLQLGKVGGHIATDARSRMLSVLDDKVDTWREINQDEQFLSWLQLPDVYSGVKRHDLLKAAWERNNTPQVLAFFKGFLDEEAATAPADPGPDQVKEVVPPKPRVPLEKFAAPGRAKTAPGNPAAEKPTITRADIAGFYAAVAAGKYRGNEAERDRLEKMVFEAQRDGRIRNS